MSHTPLPTTQNTGTRTRNKIDTLAHKHGRTAAVRIDIIGDTHVHIEKSTSCTLNRKHGK